MTLKHLFQNNKLNLKSVLNCLKQFNTGFFAVLPVLKIL